MRWRTTRHCANAVRRLGRAGDPEVLAEAESETQAAALAGQKPTDAAVADAAVSLTAAKGDAAMYEQMLRVAQSATDPDLKQDALRTLTRFQAPELVARTLEYAVSDRGAQPGQLDADCATTVAARDTGCCVGVRAAALGGDYAAGDGELGNEDCGGDGRVLHGREAG